MKVFDLHCDTITDCLDSGKDLYKNDLQLDLERGLKADTWVQTFAFWLHTSYTGNGAFNRFLNQYDTFNRFKNTYSDLIKEYDGDPKSGVCNTVLAVEGGHVLEGKLENIKELKDRDIRILTLVWNDDNEIASGVLGSDRGLTDFGKEAVRELERQDILVDISHLNEKGIDEVLSMATKPCIASHSNSRAVCDHRRNLSDEHIKRIVEMKGLCGFNFFPMFVNKGDDCTLDDFHRHFDRFLTLGAEDIFALGSDFDGAPMPSFLKDCSGLYILYDNVVKWYSKEIADKIFFENANNFFKKLLAR